MYIHGYHKCTCLLFNTIMCCFVLCCGRKVIDFLAQMMKSEYEVDLYLCIFQGKYLGLRELEECDFRTHRELRKFLGTGVFHLRYSAQRIFFDLC